MTVVVQLPTAPSVAILLLGAARERGFMGATEQLLTAPSAAILLLGVGAQRVKAGGADFMGPTEQLLTA